MAGTRDGGARAASSIIVHRLHCGRLDAEAFDKVRVGCDCTPDAASVCAPEHVHPRQRGSCAGRDCYPIEASLRSEGPTSGR